MKRFKFINIFLIITLTLSLILSGCGSKDENEDTTVNIEQEEEIGHKDIEDGTEKETKEEVDLSEDLEKGGQEEELEKEDQVKQNLESENKKEEESESVKKTNDEVESDKTNKSEQVEEDDNILKIEGKVENQLKLSLDNLKDMESIIFQGDFYSLNNFGTTAHTNFKGVNLWKLLEQEAQISSNATKVTIVAIDGYKMEFSVEQVKRQDYIDETDPDKKFPMIIAWEENGEEYDITEGPPFKLVVGQKEPGDINKPQWVSNIDKIIVE